MVTEWAKDKKKPSISFDQMHDNLEWEANAFFPAQLAVSEWKRLYELNELRTANLCQRRKLLCEFDCVSLVFRCVCSNVGGLYHKKIRTLETNFQ